MKDRNRLDQWREVISEWRKSGLRRIEYCKKNSIPTSTFDYWYRKVRTAGSAFVPIPNPPPEPTMGKVRISIDRRVMIDLLPGFDADELTRVLRAFGIVS